MDFFLLEDGLRIISRQGLVAFQQYVKVNNFHAYARTKQGYTKIFVKHFNLAWKTLKYRFQICSGRHVDQSISTRHNTQRVPTFPGSKPKNNLDHLLI